VKVTLDPTVKRADHFFAGASTIQTRWKSYHLIYPIQLAGMRTLLIGLERYERVQWLTETVKINFAEYSYGDIIFSYDHPPPLDNTTRTAPGAWLS
jgi:hypothetical protein